MSTYFEQFGGTYHEENGYLIPNLVAPETPQIGTWVRRYLHHLKTEKRVLYTQLLFSGKLSAHLEEIDRHAEEMMGSAYDTDGRTGRRHGEGQSRESDGVGQTHE